MYQQIVRIVKNLFVCTGSWARSSWRILRVFTTRCEPLVQSFQPQQLKYWTQTTTVEFSPGPHIGCLPLCRRGSLQAGIAHWGTFHSSLQFVSLHNYLTSFLEERCFKSIVQCSRDVLSQKRTEDTVRSHPSLFCSTKKETLEIHWKHDNDRR